MELEPAASGLQDRRVLLKVCLAVCLASLPACRRVETIPTERLLVVKVADAPQFSLPDPSGVAERAVHRGEAFVLRSRRPDFQWQGLFQGNILSRTGLVVASRRPLERDSYAFAEDFIDADVPASSWLCKRMGSPTEGGARCEDALLRTVATSNTLVAYVPCWSARCPMAELSDGVLTAESVPMLSDVRVVTLGGRPVLLAWSHWIRSPQWTGGSLLVLLLSPPLARAGEIQLFETDARDADKVVTWMSALETGDDALRVRGRRSTRDGQSGSELSGTNIEERWGLAPDGRLSKQ